MRPDDVLHAYYEQAPEPTPAELAAVRDAVFTSVGQRATAVEGPRRHGLRRARATALVTVAAAVAVVGVGITVLPRTESDTTGGGPDRTVVGPDGSAPQAAVTLEMVAARTGGVRQISAHDGEFVFTRRRAIVLNSTEGAGGGAPLYYVSETRHEVWAEATGLRPVRMRITTGLNARPLRPGDESRLDAVAPNWRKVRTDDPLAPGPKGRPTEKPSPPSFANPTPAFLASLPTEPDRLLALLRRTAADSGNPKWSADRLVFDMVFGLVAWSDALLSSELRAGLYRALGRLGGVEQVAGEVDLAGRRGIAIGFSDGAERQEIIIDPGSSRVLGTRNVTTGSSGGLPAGTVLESATLDQRVVDTPGATR